MKVWKSILLTVAIVALATTAFAQPKVSVYFDPEGTQYYHEFQGGITQYHDAYVVITDAEMLVGGLAFALDLDPAIHVFSTYYPNAISLGDPTAGVSIGFQTCIPGWGGVPIVGAELTLWTGNELVTNGEIRVVSHPTEGGIKVADCEGNQYWATGGVAFLTVTVDGEPTSWGTVKTLYK